jgi:hypothetical protein
MCEIIFQPPYFVVIPAEAGIQSFADSNSDGLGRQPREEPVLTQVGTGNYRHAQLGLIASDCHSREEPVLTQVGTGIQTSES